MHLLSSSQFTIVSFTGAFRHQRPLTRRRRFARPFVGRASMGERGASWGFFLVGVVVIGLLVAAGFLYIDQVTSSAVGGYDVVSLEHRVDKLKEQQQQLELEAAQLQSLKAIEERVRQLNFIVTDEVAFTSPIAQGPVAYSGGLSGL